MIVFFLQIIKSSLFVMRFWSFKYIWQNQAFALNFLFLLEKNHPIKKVGYRFGFGWNFHRFGSVAVKEDNFSVRLRLKAKNFGSVAVESEEFRFGCGWKRRISVRLRLKEKSVGSVSVTTLRNRAGLYPSLEGSRTVNFNEREKAIKSRFEGSEDRM